MLPRPLDADGASPKSLGDLGPLFHESREFDLEVVVREAYVLFEACPQLGRLDDQEVVTDRNLPYNNPSESASPEKQRVLHEQGFHAALAGMKVTSILRED